jgi:hypothetical protein
MAMVLLFSGPTGCNRHYDGNEESFLFKGKRLTLRDEIPPLPIPIDDSVFSNPVQTNIKYEIGLFVARIPFKGLKITKITFPFENDPNRCQIQIYESERRQTVLFLKRDQRGVWRLDEAERWIG